MLVNTSTSRKHAMIAPRKQSHLLRLVGVGQYRSRRLRNTFLQAILAKPVVFVSCFYDCLAFAWVIGINKTLTIFLTIYKFGPKQIGYFHFTPIVALILGLAVGPGSTTSLQIGIS